MTQQHPITPPPELVQQWRKSGPADAAVNNAYEYHIATQAARWGADQQLQLDAEQINQAWQKGADQELEACCEWIADWYGNGYNEVIGHLRSARRPKPPSLKEQALEALDSCSCDEADSWKLIRRALEQLDD